jgi:UDP-glucose 4-epimerase
MRIYITGAAGFLGSHLADWFVARGDDVVTCDNLATGDLANLPSGLHHYTDIENLSPVDLHGVDVVFHCAALAYEGTSHFSPSLISRNIYAGSAAVFSAAIAAGVKRIVYTSSMARYGNLRHNHLLFHEWAAPDPVDPYGIAKETAERLLVNLCETHGIEWSIAVPHNIYGPRQRYIDPYRNVAAIMANLMLMGQRPVIYGDGKQVRCFSYIDDVVPTLARMGLDPIAKGEIINVGPDEGAVTILALGEIIAEIAGVHFNPVFLPSRPREVKHAVCSSDKARNLLGFEQEVGLVKGLEKLVAYIRERGPKPFVHHLPIEIESGLLPLTWKRRTA